MGAESFIVKWKGKTAKAAFEAIVEETLHWEGHGGYTGTIAEKSEFVVIDLPDNQDAEEYAESLMDACDARINDKWGPAGCIKLPGEEWLFFGWAAA